MAGVAGYFCVPGLIPAQECRQWSEWLAAAPAPVEWMKGHAVNSRHFHDIALDYRIVQHVQAALGTQDVLLWGASLLKRVPGQRHAWHSDIESSHAGARVISVWLALQNTTTETSLTVQPGSHAYGASVQETAHRHGVLRDDITEAHIAEWGRELGGKESPLLVPMMDGDALFFDGRLWHGSHNLDPAKERLAVLLQYTAADAPVRMPDMAQLTWPFRFYEQPWPPCIRVSGTDRSLVNRIVSPPLLHQAEHGQRLGSSTQVRALPFVEEGFAGFRSFPFFRGFSHHLADLSCHASVLSRGQCPHPPHQHPEEEVLLVLSGRAEITLPTLAGTEGGDKQILEGGQMVYYPAGFYHTLRGASDELTHYVMVKWLGATVEEYPPLAFRRDDVNELPVRALGGCDGFHPGLVFEGATRYLSKLHVHVTLLEAGAGYAPHADEYDVILMVLEGEVETLGKRVGPLGVVYYAAGEDHGIRNPGVVAARYLVLELHGTAGQRLQLGRKVSGASAASGPVKPGQDAVLKKLEKLTARMEKQMAKQNEMQKGLEKFMRKRHRLSLMQKLISKERWAKRWRRWTGGA